MFYGDFDALLVITVILDLEEPIDRVIAVACPDIGLGEFGVVARM